MNYKFFSLTFGFSVWLVATFIFKIAGHRFFLIDNSFLLVGFFIGTIPGLYCLSSFVFNKFELDYPSRLRSAVLMAVPGMLCDVVCLKFHYIVFPNLTIEQSIVLGAWIIWAYVIVLLIGIFLSEE